MQLLLAIIAFRVKKRTQHNHFFDLLKTKDMMLHLQDLLSVQ